MRTAVNTAERWSLTVDLLLRRHFGQLLKLCCIVLLVKCLGGLCQFVDRLGDGQKAFAVVLRRQRAGQLVNFLTAKSTQEQQSRVSALDNPKHGPSTTSSVSAAS
jgi:hypothetical protein